MSLIALSMHFDVSIVIVAHIARILLVALGAAPILALTGARRSPAGGTPALDSGDRTRRRD